MSRDNQIIGEWKFDEEIHGDLWNSGGYRTITFEGDVVDEQTYEGLAYFAHREELRELLVNAYPLLAYNHISGVESATHLANVILANDYRKSSEVAREIFEEIERIRMIERTLYKRGVEGCYNSDSDYAELKKKYTEEKR